MEASFLHCPIRGSLRVRQRANDQFTFTEEKQRIDAIRYLLQKKYPKENFGIEATLFKLGNAGRNSFRTDFAVYNEPFSEIRALPPDERIKHLRLLAEIKRDNKSAEVAKATQVKSALQLVPDLTALGVYWDDIEQRFFYRTVVGRQASIHDAPISKIPAWGDGVSSTQLAYSDLDPAKDLIRIFDEIEDTIHTHIVDKSARYTLIQQLLLLKIYDENAHKTGRGQAKPLDFQDFSEAAISDSAGLKRMNDVLAKAAAHYNLYLPDGKKIEDKFHCTFEVLRNVTKILAPINILGSKVQVIQQFYMKFAKSLYKWDLAQYFTPHEVIDFIVELTNPQQGEHVYDPACGSADFLISAYRRCGNPSNPSVWGADNSEQATQISILNMVMNGDGKTQIKTKDSLATYTASHPSYDVVLCNPPFGTRIVERRYEVLRKFDVAYKWEKAEIGATKCEVVRDSQQTGILFAELCVRLTKPGGRIGIILPNGYLGNKSIEYLSLREWLLCHTKLVAIVAFPRFTFKKSGADVSASVVVMEKRFKPLQRAQESEEYEFFAGNIESVGWRAGDKTAVPIYVQDPLSGQIILNEENEPILDADFQKCLAEFVASPAADCFSWVNEDRPHAGGAQTEGIDIRQVASLPDLNLDPKRYSEKFRRIRSSIMASDHFSLGDLLTVVPSERFKVDPAKIYHYVEIENVGIGEYDFEELRGWQLAARAKLPALAGDIFIAHLWSCAGKWFMAAGDCTNIVVTNGCARLRLKADQKHMLPQLAVGLCSEAFRVQVRGFSTGSDGLAEISDIELLKIVLPKVLTPFQIKQIEPHLAALEAGDFRFARFASEIIKATKDFTNPPRRRSHVSLL